MNTSTELPPSSDDRILAAASHFFGLFVAIIVLLVNKDKSRFLRFQALQAILFDLVVGFGSGLVIFLIFFGLFFLGMLFMIGAIVAAGSFASGSSSDSYLPFLVLLPSLLPMSMFCIIIPWALVLMVARLVAAISVLNGKDFRYPWLGKWVEKMNQGSEPLATTA